MTEMKHKLGDTVFWIDSSCNYRKSVPCPMCFGKLEVTIILGNGEKSKIECGFCSHGIEGANGKAKIWAPYAEIKMGEITGISTGGGLRYEVSYRHLKEHEIFTTKESAEVDRVKRYAEEKICADNFFRDRFIDAKKNQVWSAGYHKRCIKDAEKTINWHMLRLRMIEEKQCKTKY